MFVLCLLPLTSCRNSADPKIQQELAARYKAALSEREKLTVCINAINERVIAAGAPVDNIERVFGASYPLLLFAEQEPVPPEFANNEMLYQRRLVGWYLCHQGDAKGRIAWYYVSNTHKSDSGPVSSAPEAKRAEFAKEYVQSTSEVDRLFLCIDALDREAIYRGEPAEEIDRVFGTDFSTAVSGKAIAADPFADIDVRVFIAPKSVSSQGKTLGWYICFTFRHGRVGDYYLSNTKVPDYDAFRGGRGN